MILAPKFHLVLVHKTCFYKQGYFSSLSFDFLRINFNLHHYHK